MGAAAGKLASKVRVLMWRDGSLSNKVQTSTRSDKKSQEYSKVLQQNILVMLTVKDSKNITSSFRQYYVKIICRKGKFAGWTQRETNRIFALRGPKWNETLEFIVTKDDWEKQEELDLECILCSVDYDMKITEMTTQTNMKDLKTRKCITFGENIEVYVEVDTQQHTDVEFRNIDALCIKEYEFVCKRKELVKTKMMHVFKMGNIPDVPNIAIIGSGGGIRAVIGMSGAMTALQDEGILDMAMYTAGLSGSAWYLLTLYAYGEKLNTKAVNSSLRQNLRKGYVILFFKAWLKWKYPKKSRHFATGKYVTVTDTFGEMIGALLLGKKCKQKWSEQSRKLEDGSIPLPILAALLVRYKEKTDNHEWMELSPYEALLPKLGLGIDMKNFGNQFYGGFVIKKYEENPIHFLAGIVGSAYAAGKNYKETGTKQKKTWKLCCRNCLAITVIIGCSIHLGKELHTLGYSVATSWILSLFDSFDDTFIGTIPSWLHGIWQKEKTKENTTGKATIIEWEPGPKTTAENTTGKDTQELAKKYKERTKIDWESGEKTTAVSDSDNVDNEENAMRFADAGIALNSPYPSVLNPSRKVDIIISFDFSDRGDDKQFPFEELLKAEKWAKEEQIPFPKIDLDKIQSTNNEYAELYIFESDEAPTIMHFVMTNNKFRTMEGEDQQMRNFNILPDYSTMKFHYTDQQFDKFKLLIEFNVLENKDRIFNCIKDVIRKKTNEKEERDRLEMKEKEEQLEMKEKEEQLEMKEKEEQSKTKRDEQSRVKIKKGHEIFMERMMRMHILSCAMDRNGEKHLTGNRRLRLSKLISK